MCTTYSTKYVTYDCYQTTTFIEPSEVWNKEVPLNFYQVSNKSTDKLLDGFAVFYYSCIPTVPIVVLMNNNVINLSLPANVPYDFKPYIKAIIIKTMLREYSLVLSLHLNAFYKSKQKTYYMHFSLGFVRMNWSSCFRFLLLFVIQNILCHGIY